MATTYHSPEGLNMGHDETGCKAPEGPTYCINNCGFFGSAATMNMCSKCHKDMVVKQEQAKLAASSIGCIMNNTDSDAGKGKGLLFADASDVATALVDPPVVMAQPRQPVALAEGDGKPKVGPSGCNSCNKRVGLAGFRCKCGELFCAVHRHFEKHNCKFDYKACARDAITKANPVIKAEKLNKI